LVELTTPILSQAYGHSTVVDPWGKVLYTTGHEPALVVTEELDVNAGCQEVRSGIPISFQVRTDLYENVRAKAEDSGSKKMKL
jgi:omega-amidase